MSNPSQKIPKDESLLVEYAATNDAYMHYDSYSWQVGAVLIAGAFIFWGFLIDQNIDACLLIVGSALVTILMSIWMMYSHHNRQIYLCKLRRLREIETILGLKQHRRWVPQGSETQPAYRTFGPAGHCLDALIYIITSIGSPLIGRLKIGPNPWFALPVLLVPVVLAWTCCNERKLSKHLAQLSGEENAD